MSDAPKNGNGKKWLVYALPLASAVFAVIGAVYLIGQRTNKIVEVVEWKKETAPRIERMDSQGTVSFTLFHVQYDKEQGQQYERIKELERKAEQIEVLKSRIERLERERNHENSN